MSGASRLVVLLNGSPVAGSSVERLLEEVARGAEDAGAATEHVRCHGLRVRPCEACGPEPSDHYCVFNDAMDRVYELLERSHAVVVGSPVYFDTVSAQLKLVMDRCNCVTVLTHEGTFRPRWKRTRHGLFVTACSDRHRYDLAERSVRGFLKWIGARWQETIAWQHADNDRGSVAGASELLARARAAGRRVAEAPPLEG